MVKKSEAALKREAATVDNELPGAAVTDDERARQALIDDLSKRMDAMEAKLAGMEAKLAEAEDEALQRTADKSYDEYASTLHGSVDALRAPY